MTLEITSEHTQAMRAVEDGRIAWVAAPAEKFVRRTHAGGPFAVFPTRAPDLGQLIALCALKDAGLIEVAPAPTLRPDAASHPAPDTTNPNSDPGRPRLVRLTDRGRALLAPSRPTATT